MEVSIKNKILEEAYKGSYYTIIGAGGDINEWKNGYSDMLKQQDIGNISNWIEFTGKDMNEEFMLEGYNKYPDNLHFLAFSLVGLNITKLALFKLQMGDRWFDDIVDNLTANDTN